MYLFKKKNYKKDSHFKIGIFFVNQIKLNEDEIKKILLNLKDENKNMGKIMKYFNSNHGGKVDNNLVIKLIKDTKRDL